MMRKAMGLTAAILCAVGIGVTWPAIADDSSARTAILYRESYQLEATRDLAGSLSRMKEVVNHSQKTYYSIARIAWLSYLSGDFVAAEAAYREAGALAPKAIEPKLGLTSALLAAKKWRDLERACREALAVDANHAVTRARLAFALYMIGNYPDSAALYRRLVEEFPAELEYQTGFGWDLLKMGKRAEARGVFQAVLAVSPDNVSAKQGMIAP